MQLVNYDIGHDLILTPSECKEIVDWFDNKIANEEISVNKAQTRHEGNNYSEDYNPEYRQGHTTSARGFPYEQEIIEAVQRYAKLTGIRLYEDVWSQDRQGFSAVNWQYTIYKDPGDKFNEHQDQSVSHHTNVWFNNLDHNNPNRWMYRKISCSLQLTDPNTYEGCDLRIRNERNKVEVYPRTQGSVIVFPSYAHHTVTPLTSGTRYAMVGWFLGPHWR